MFYLLRSYWLVFTAPIVRVIVQYVITKDAKLILPLEFVMLSLAVIAAIIRWLSISITLTPENLIIKKGVLIRTFTTIDKSQVFAISGSQSLFSAIIGCERCNISTVAEHNKKMILKLKKRDFKIICNVFCDKDERLQLKRQENPKRFMTLPLVFLIAIITLVSIYVLSFRQIGSLELLAIIVLIALDLYYAGFCYYNYKNGKLYLGRCVSASSTQVFSVVKFHCNNVGVIKITQNPFDRRFGTCKIKFTAFGESGESVKVKHLQHKTALEQLNQEFKLNINE